MSKPIDYDCVLDALAWGRSTLTLNEIVETTTIASEVVRQILYSLVNDGSVSVAIEKDGSTSYSLSGNAKRLIFNKEDFTEIKHVKEDMVGVVVCDRSGLPKPTVLISPILWDNEKRPMCPSCKNLPLRPHEYCIRCDRWGMDHVLEHRKNIFNKLINA